MPRVGAGKWRPTYTSGEEDEGANASDAYSQSDREMSASHDDEDSDSDTSGKLPPCSPHALATQGTGSGQSSRLLGLGNSTLMPPVPHTTPRASASPDLTPLPPATSPSHRPRRDSTLGDDPSDMHRFGHSPSRSGSGAGELQSASPLLLPRGLMSPPLDSIFGVSPIVGKDSVAADMLTPVISTAATMLDSSDSATTSTIKSECPGQIDSDEYARLS
ncbi:hypothetical protein EC988_007619, partial [Linderina pennispora]